MTWLVDKRLYDDKTSIQGLYDEMARRQGVV